MPERGKWFDIFTKSLRISRDRAVELGKIATIKSEIYLEERKMNHTFKELGEKFYTLLKEGKEVNDILKLIQPFINSIEKIEQKIEKEKEKIESLKRELKLSENESSIIDEIANKQKHDND